MRLSAITTALVALATLTGCGSQSEPAAPVTVTAAPTTEKPTPAVKKRVPNVVGKVHQQAQNELQAAGFYALAELDATGQGRMLVLDRNWQVVKQRPKAGSVVSTDTTITLYSKKIGE